METGGHTTMIKVGDTIYYSRLHGNYREVIVISETSRSWVVAGINDAKLYKDSVWFVKQCTKLPKNGNGWVQGTKHDVDLQQWYFANRHGVATVLEGQEPAMVLAVAKLIHYNNLPEEK